MKNAYLKRVFKLTAVGLAMMILYIFFADLMKFNNTNSELHVRNFYREPENTIDVGLIGASEMYADYSAPLAYQKYGFTSYNLLCCGNYRRRIQINDTRDVKPADSSAAGDRGQRLFI